MTSPTHTTSVHKLENGAELLLIHTPAARSVFMTINIHSGFYHAVEKNPATLHLPHLLEHMVFEGSKNYPSYSQLMTALNQKGSYSNGSTHRYTNSFQYRATYPALVDTIPVLFDMIYRPLLTQQSLYEEKAVIYREIGEDMNNFGSVCAQSTIMQLWPDREIDFHQQIQDLDTLGINQVHQYHKKYYTATNTQIVVALDTSAVSTKNIINMFNRETKELPTGKRIKDPQTTLQKPTVPLASIKTAETIESVEIMMAFACKDEVDEKQYRMLNIFEHSISDIEEYGLCYKLRKSGFVYSLNTNILNVAQTRLLLVNLAVDKSDYVAALAHTLRGISELANTPLSAEDFQYIKEKDHGGLLLASETPGDYEDWYGGLFVSDFELLSPEKFAEMVLKITQQEVLELAQQLIKNENLYISVMGADAGKYEEVTDFIRKKALDSRMPIEEVIQSTRAFQPQQSIIAKLQSIRTKAN